MPALTPAGQTGTQFTYFGGIKDKVDLGVGLHLGGFAVHKQSPIHLIVTNLTRSQTHDLSTVSLQLHYQATHIDHI